MEDKIVGEDVVDVGFYSLFINLLLQAYAEHVSTIFSLSISLKNNSWSPLKMAANIYICLTAQVRVGHLELLCISLDAAHTACLLNPFTPRHPLGGWWDIHISMIIIYPIFSLFSRPQTMKFGFSTWFWLKIVLFYAAMCIAGGLTPANNALLFDCWELPDFQSFWEWKG